MVTSERGPEKIILRHKFIRTNEVQLHMTQAGPVDGPPVFLLHGFPEFWRGWIHQIGPLARAGYRVIVPDQRGYNLSDKPSGLKNYHIDTLARDITGLMDALGYDQVYLAGHDWGAAVAWHLAIYYPQRLKKLAILNVPHPDVMVDYLTSRPQQLLKSWYIFFFQIPWLPEFLMRRGGFDPMRRMMRLSSRPETFSEAELDAYVRAWGQPGALTGMLNWYRAVFRQGMRSVFGGGSDSPKRVRIPTLILWGVNDIALSQEMARPSRELCKQGELIFFEDATHWVQHDAPEEISDLLIKHFTNG